MNGALFFFEIQSSNPARELAFYQAAFGWEFTREPLPIEYYKIKTAGISGGLLQRPVAIPPLGTGTNAFACTFQVDRFDKTAEIILKNGGQVAMDKFALLGRGWQGYFLDADNNTFGVFQQDDKAQ